MAIQPSLVQYGLSTVRGKKVEVGRLYDDGFLFLKDDPGVWIQSNPHSVSSVRSLELDLIWYEGDRIGDSIGELSQLTHLSIYGGRYLKCLLNTLSRLHYLHHLELNFCKKPEDLPPNLGDLYNLTYLSLMRCHSLKLIGSVPKLSNLTTLFISGFGKLKELPANLGDLKFLASLFLNRFHRLVGWKDVKADGNCGFDFRGSQEIDVYQMIYGDDYDSALKRLDWNDGIIEQASPHRPSNHQPDATRIIEDPTSNDNPNAFISLPNHEIENWPTSNEAGTIPVVVNEYYSDVNAYTTQDHDPMDIEGNNNAVLQYNNRDGVVTDIAAEPSSKLHETNSSGLTNQQLFQLEQIANILELEQGTSSIGSFKGQDNIYQRGSGVQHKTQKIRGKISLDRINELKSQNLTLEVAASKEHLGVSRSTLKRRLKELGMKWSSKEEGMNPDTNRKETHSTCERNLSQPNSMDASNPVSHGQGVEHIAGSSQPTLSYHLPSEHNVVNNSTPDVVTTTVGEPPLSTQYCMDSHQHVEEHPNDGVRKPALVNTDLPPNERCSTFVVKATFNEDTTRFNFSLSSSIEKLKEEVGKSLDLEVGTFKIRYLDDEKEWMLMNRISDLELALNLSRASGSNVVRLSISLKT